MRSGTLRRELASETLPQPSHRAAAPLGRRMRKSSRPLDPVNLATEALHINKMMRTRTPLPFSPMDHGGAGYSRTPVGGREDEDSSRPKGELRHVYSGIQTALQFPGMATPVASAPLEGIPAEHATRSGSGAVTAEDTSVSSIAELKEGMHVTWKDNEQGEMRQGRVVAIHPARGGHGGSTATVRDIVARDVFVVAVQRLFVVPLSPAEARAKELGGLPPGLKEAAEMCDELAETLDPEGVDFLRRIVSAVEQHYVAEARVVAKETANNLRHPFAGLPPEDVTKEVWDSVEKTLVAEQALISEQVDSYFKDISNGTIEMSEEGQLYDAILSTLRARAPFTLKLLDVLVQNNSHERVAENTASRKLRAALTSYVAMKRIVS